MKHQVKELIKVYFPYCIEKQEDGSWVLLNRDYKPVGFNTEEYIKYENYPISIHFLKRPDPATLKKLSHRNEVQGNKIYLYNDGCVPTSSEQAMSSYLKKLEILFKLRIKH